MQCSRIKLDGKPCERDAFVRGVCLFHDSLDQTKKRKNLSKEAWYQILESLWTFQDEAKAFSILSETLCELTPKEATTFHWKYKAEVFRYHERDGTPLYVVADNSHNVQATPVEDQTERTLALLRTLDRPVGQDIPSEILTAWMMHDSVPGTHMIAVGQDLHTWYSADPLYAEILDLLWAYIQSSASRDELVLRLYQEAKDSKKKCAQGHRTRLCNVPVGFDDAFTPPVSTRELLALKMLSISQKTMTVERKVGEAWKVFETLQTPMEEREAWIREF